MGAVELPQAKALELLLQMFAPCFIAHCVQRPRRRCDLQLCGHYPQERRVRGLARRGHRAGMSEETHLYVEAALAAKRSSRKSVGQGPPIGYARVSTEDQNLALQLDALKKIGCERVFTDKIGGGQVARPGPTDALSHLRTGDTLVVWKLNRLGRKSRASSTWSTTLTRQVHFRSRHRRYRHQDAGGTILLSHHGQPCTDGA